MTTLPDQIPLSLIQRARTESDAQAEVLAMLKPHLDAIIRQARLSAWDAEDAAQDAALIAINCMRLHQSERGTFLAYVSCSVRRHLRGIGASVGKSLNRVPEPLIMPDDPVSELMADLQELPTLHREVVCDFYGIGREQCGTREIAERRKIPAGGGPRTSVTVRKILAEAIQILSGQGDTLKGLVSDGKAGLKPKPK